ncbi:MAG: acyltransferase family protein [Faecalibacterium sp.]|jgi:fucose 4-O-acetylase-like acetyltransferase|nr:acyltransferase family protein [Faecalibacterium sp.]
MTKHSDRLDTIRALLIFFVVFGHALEKVSFPGRDAIYFFIYTFHMPAFAFLSGLCFKPVDGSRIFRRYLYPYLIFQTLYLLFSAYETGKAPVFEFTTPQHVLWYLLALIFWNVAATLLHITAQAAPCLLIGSTVLALIAGFEPTIGRYLSLSRILVFSPFFLAGVCIKTLWLPALHTFLQKPHFRLRLLAVAIPCAIAALEAFYAPVLDFDWFYEASPYSMIDATVGFRLILFLCAAVITSCLFFLIPDRPIPILSKIGQHTMAIYLVHDFVIRFLAKIGWFSSLKIPLISAFVLSLVLVFLFSREITQQILSPFLEWPLAHFGAKKAKKSGSVTA